MIFVHGLLSMKGPVMEDFHVCMLKTVEPVGVNVKHSVFGQLFYNTVRHVPFTSLNVFYIFYFLTFIIYRIPFELWV